MCHGGAGLCSEVRRQNFKQESSVIKFSLETVVWTEWTGGSQAGGRAGGWSFEHSGEVLELLLREQT